MASFVVGFAVILLQLNSLSAITPQFSLTYFNGNSLVIHESTPSLPHDEVSENCNRGIWVTYSGENYTFGEETFETSSIAMNMEGSCAHPVDPLDRVWSVRSVGISSDNRIPSATFFSDWLVTGSIVVVDGGVPNITFPFLSLVTINTNVEFYTEPNYGGESFCFQSMYPDNCTEGVCVVWTWMWEYELPWDLPNLAKSARIGCTPKERKNRHPKVIHPKYPMPSVSKSDLYTWGK